MHLHSHATDQMVRCFAMKTNFMSLPSSRRRLRPFLDIPLGLKTSRRRNHLISARQQAFVAIRRRVLR
jgi:hypothetical protein